MCSIDEQALLANDPLLASIVTKLGAAPGSSGLASKRIRRQLVDVKIWVIDFAELTLRRQIGAGSFGRVRPQGVGMVGVRAWGCGVGWGWGVRGCALPCHSCSAVQQQASHWGSTLLVVFAARANA
jgi:hypothetical protein